MKIHLKKVSLFLLNWIADDRYDDIDFETARQIMLFNIGASIGVIFSVLFGTIVYIRDIPNLWLVDYGNAFFLVLLLIYTRKSKNYDFGLYAAIGLFTLLCFYLLITGGDSLTGYAWYFVYPLIAFFGLGTKKGTMATIILTVPVLILFSLENPPGIIAVYTSETRVRFLGTFLLIAALSYVIESVRENTYSRLEKKNADLNEVILKLRETDEKLRRIGTYLEKEVELQTQQLRETNLKLRQEIEERVRAEEALRQSEEKFRLIAENTGDVITVFDKKMRATYMSPSCFRVRGYLFEEAKEQSLDQVMTPESVKKVIALYQEEMDLEKTGTADPNRVRIVELEEYRKDGSTIWIEDSFSFIRDKHQQVTGVLSIARNINERKQAEKERTHLEEQLKQAQKLEAIGTLAGGLAHDFNNLLMTIQGYASLILMEIEPSNPHHERLKQMEQQVAHGASLTRQLLGFARGGRYEVKPTNMNTVIDRTLSMFGLTNKEIDVHIDFEWDLRTVEVDQGQMEQVLMNLFVNAGQAMSGGGEITVQTDNCRLNEDQAMPNDIEPGQYIKITITDTGTGMDENTLKRIFDPFFTTKALGRGTGLGLAMVYGIIKSHHGMIDVTSSPGRGTTFFIYLPASEKIEVQEEKAIEEILTGTETILLVDDEESVLEVSAELLSALGYRIHAACCGQEAVAIYMEKQKDIDMVILDMIMPGISGAETFERLREINPDVRVLLSSGYSLDGQAQLIMSRGCKGFLQKPFELQVLSKKVRDLLIA